MIEAPEFEKIYTLSPMQEGMLFSALMDEDSRAYFAQTTVWIKGRLDIALFERSFNVIIKRYDIFRTNFVHQKLKQPRQVVLKDRQASVYYEDISGMKEEEKGLYVAEFRTKDVERGFDLMNDMLIRVAVLKMEEDKYCVAWSFHHIIMDGWCIGIVLKEFFQVYKSLVEGKPVSLEKTYPFSGYIEWLEKQDKEAAVEYWKGYLKGYIKQVEFPRCGKTAPGIYENAVFNIELDEALSQGLEEVAKENQVTLNNVLTAIWGIMLQKYNDTDDVVFGTIVSGRPYEVEGIEKMVGLFINAVPVRIRYDREQSFSGLIKQLQREALESEKFSYLPLADIQSVSDLKQELINKTIGFDNYPVDRSVESQNLLPDLKLEIEASEIREQSNYEFNAVFSPGTKISCMFHYNSHAYNMETINMIKNHFLGMAAHVVKNPGASIAEISFNTPDEKKLVLEKFNNKPVKYPINKTICDMFEEQAAKTPDVIAAVYENESVSYRQLNEKANVLACVLREKGIKPGAVVGLISEKSIKLVVGILGIMKSGGVYLPIDPQYPEERINYMLEDSEAVLLVTNKAGYFNDEADIETLSIEDDEFFLTERSNPEKVNNPEDLAYIIYTSGTTGKPKGVMVEHRSISNTMQWRKDEYGLTGEDRVLQLFSYAFDGFLACCLTPLLSGATVFFLRDIKDSAAIANCIYQQKITHFVTVPVIYNAILESLTAEKAGSLKKVTLVAEKCLPNIIESSRKINPEIEIINEYGPTENSITSTLLRNMQLYAPSNIGFPIANNYIYILDENLAPQPVGVAGELCVSGIGLARGYLKLTELTGDKFVRNPFSDKYPTDRLYRTGDLARWLPDGSIEFLGRIDRQVKIRGFRIEPGEIESELLKHGLVKEAVVVDREDEAENKYLCAYIVSFRELESDELIEFLSEKLPEYMIPSYFVRLENIPLTPNNKLDRDALPDPKAVLEALEEYVAPRDEMEETLARIWEEVLEIENVGVTTNFFKLGGHSLKATILAARIYKEFEIDIPLVEVFKTPTIEALARCIKQAQEEEEE